MKTVKTTRMKGLLLSFGLGLISFSGFSQEHITLSLENITAKSNTIEYDLFIVNDGTTPLRLSACAYGVNYNGVILNGTTPSDAALTYIEGTRSQALNGMSPYNLLNTNRDGANQLRLTMKPAKKENCATLVANVPYKVGHFKFTNNSSWTSNSSPAMTLNEFNITGLSTSCALAYVNGGSNYVGFSVAKKNLAVRVANSPVLNPTSITGMSATLNGAVRMQTMQAQAQEISREGSSFESTENKISMYPNPTQDNVHIDLYAASVVNTVVKVTDIRGRIVKQIQARSEKGLNTMTVSLLEVPSGVYTIQVFQDNQLSFTDQLTKKD